MNTTILDIRGQICPSALLTALRTLNTHRESLREGQLRVTILTDARDATETIPQAARNMGYCVRVTAEKGVYTICVWAREGGPSREEP